MSSLGVVTPASMHFEAPLPLQSGAVLKDYMTEDILNAVVLVLPNKRNLHLLGLVLECALADGQTICATQTLLGGPA